MNGKTFEILSEKLEDKGAIILGIDSYLRWPLALKLLALGCKVSGVDNYCRRDAVVEEKAESVSPISSMKDCIKVAREILTKDNIKVEQDIKRMRPSDVSLLLGDSSKFRNDTGRSAEIPFEKTMEDLLNYWRDKV